MEKEKPKRKKYPNIQWTSSWRKGEGITFQKWRWTTADKIQDLRASQQQGHDVFRGVWLYAEPEPDSEKIGDLHLDFDSAEPEESRRDAIAVLGILEQHYDINPRCCEILFSGKKGIAVVLPFECFLSEPLPEPHKQYKAVVKYLGLSALTLDLSPCKSRAMWRISNSVHTGSGLHRIQLTYDQLRDLTIEQIKTIATKPRQVKREPPEFSETLASIMKKLAAHEEKFEVVRESGAKDRDYSGLRPEQKIPKKYRKVHGEGERHNAYVSLLSTLKKAGVEKTEASEILFAFNQEYCSPSKTEAEVQIPLDYVYDHY